MKKAVACSDNCQSCDSFLCVREEYKGEILSTDDTAAGFCSFCGASTVLYSRIEKEHRPAYIIPFLSIGLLTLSFSNVDGSSILWMVVTIASFVFLIKSFTRFDRLPGHKGLFGLIFNMVTLL